MYTSWIAVKHTIQYVRYQYGNYFKVELILSNLDGLESVDLVLVLVGMFIDLYNLGHKLVTDTSTPSAAAEERTQSDSQPNEPTQYVQLISKMVMLSRNEDPASQDEEGVESDYQREDPPPQAYEVFEADGFKWSHGVLLQLYANDRYWKAG
jgi:hypothetical protein